MVASVDAKPGTCGIEAVDTENNVPLETGNQFTEAFVLLLQCPVVGSKILRRWTALAMSTKDVIL